MSQSVVFPDGCVPPLARCSSGRCVADWSTLILPPQAARQGGVTAGLRARTAPCLSFCVARPRADW
eukprot:14740483-Alexandrium_andersonii.AAC.1